MLTHKLSCLSVDSAVFMLLLLLPLTLGSLWALSLAYCSDVMHVHLGSSDPPTPPCADADAAVDACADEARARDGDAGVERVLRTLLRARRA